MKSLLLTLFLSVSYAAILNFNKPCNDWCGSFCQDSCSSKLATSICMGETQCRCLCPTRQADCNETWCNNYCKGKAVQRKFEAHCEEKDQLCKCQFDQTGQVSSKIQPVNITFVADPSLLKADFKCTNEFCVNYCTKHGEGRKFEAKCDETQSCNCQYEQKTVPNLKSLSVGNDTPATCTKKWCSDFCNSKSNGLDVEATCDEKQTCQCAFASKTSIKASGGPDHSLRDDSNSTISRRSEKKFECTISWCNNYCDSKSNGRKFTSSCNEKQECKCEYAWQPTGKKTISDSSTTNSTENIKSKCTKDFCDNFCSEKSNGRQFTSTCDENQVCKCEYAWQPTGKNSTN